MTLSLPRFSRPRLAAALAAVLFAAPAAGAEATLSGEEIRAAVSDSTVEGSMAATGRFAEYYSAEGAIRGKDYVGVWSIEGDEMCFRYGADPAECWKVGRDGQELLWIRNGEVLGRGEVRRGNPNGF